MELEYRTTPKANVLAAMEEYRSLPKQLEAVEFAEWISVEDRLPEVGQIVDIWEMPRTQHLQRALSLRGTDYAKKYYSEPDYVGWRSCNYKFSIEEDDKGVLNCFTKLYEKHLHEQESYDYKKICVENGEVTHWMPLPAPPKK